MSNEQRVTGTLAGPPRVQIQTMSGCNGRCVFCPNEELLKTDAEHGRMSLDLFRKIIDELAETHPRRILLYLMNEPLADKRMPELVQYTAERVPETTTLITTNGTYLNASLSESLIDAGLKRLKVSLQSLDPEINREIMGYSSEKVIENVITAQRIIKKKRAKQFDLRVSMVVTSLNLPEIEQTRSFWRKHGVRLVTSALENRGGNIAAAENLNPDGLGMRSMGDCIRPSRDMCVLFNGDVALCCVDWFRTTVVGNVAQQSLREVWNGPELQRIREGLHEGNAAKLPPICVNCTESACPNHHRRGLKGWFNRLAAAF
ncbi:MAG: radical SAM protein [Candidatus Hydrogenedentes bacterium]|nr:radical SAM protein [Candidatus Hydrogenedentota bacterium]